ncbi:MAG: site-specific integrase [Prevotellaceae bacterium]|jgi:integrase|nr:site-specific integrase [Prevotellaceae bacterium]
MNNRVIFSTVYNRNNRLTKKGTAQIEVCATQNGKRKYFGTGIQIKPEIWDNQRRRIKSTAQNAIQLNKQINDIVQQLENYVFERKHAEKPLTLDFLANCMQGKDFKYFTDFVKYELETDTTKERATVIHKTTTYKVLREYKSNILFEEINFDFLKGFENYLIKKGLATNTIKKYFQNIRAWVNLAINKDYMTLDKYPFRNKFRLKTEETQRCFLSPEEVQSIENLELIDKNAHLEKIRDMFLFACYTGLRFSDITALSKDCLSTQDGNLWLEMKMQKTKNTIRLPLYLLHKNTVELLNKYTRPDYKYFFDELTNQYVNRSLKEIAALAGITKKVTFHTARHTCATFLLYKGVAITTVQKVLGHKKVSVTQIYAKQMDMTMVNELSKVKY